MNELLALTFPLARGILGWLENALEDGVIDWPEWKRLMKTIVMLGTPIVIIGIGVEVANLDHLITVISGMVVSIADWLYSQTKKGFKKK